MNIHFVGYTFFQAKQLDDIADATVNASENIGSGNLEINQVCRLCNHTIIIQ